MNGEVDQQLQELLDPDGMGRGIRILKRVEDGPEHIAYYVDGGHEFAGRDRWVRVPKASNTNTRAKAIRDGLAYP